MKAVISQKVQSNDTTYGQKIGGFEGTSTPVGAIRVDYLENVTSVVLDTSGTEPVYSITHKTGADSTAHTATYSSEHYNIAVIGE